MKSIQGKSYTHRGTPFMVFLSLGVIILLALLVRLKSINEQFYIYLLIIVVLLFGLLCVYKITITFDNTYFAFKLGIGLIKKRYKIADIKSCKLYSGISKRFGIGYKMGFGGILEYYIVTGLKVIELQFYDNRAIVRIGTPLADEISQQIQSLIEEERND